jgi:hypothetical protein
MIEKVLDLPEGFLTDYQPTIQQRVLKTTLIEGGRAFLKRARRLASSAWLV